MNTSQQPEALRLEAQLSAIAAQAKQGEVQP